MNAIDINQSEACTIDGVLAEESYKRVEEELEALPAETLTQVNLDIKSSTATGLGCKPKIESLRPQFRKLLRDWDERVIDKLEDFAYALMFAQSLYQIACEPNDELPELATQGAEMRDVLHTDATALVRRKLIAAALLDDYSGLVGYKNIATDLQLLYTALSSNYERIEGRCGTTRKELDLAGRLAGRMMRLVGLREQAPARIARAADQRARAFTLFVNSYDEIRRAVGFVRWHQGDADLIAPSLYAGRKRREADDTEQPTEPPPAEPTAPVVNRSLDNLPGGSPFIS